MNRCLHCSATVTNGLALCERCRAALLVRLAWVPVHFRNLARVRPAPRINASMPRPESISLRGDDDAPVKRRANGLTRIANSLDLAHNDLTTWARALADDRPHLAEEIDALSDLHEAPFVTAFCELLAERVDTLMTLPWVGELVRGLGRIERRLGNLTDELVPGWRAGACPDCGTARFVEPGVTWVKCGGCGATSRAADQLEIVLNEARDWVARPRQIGDALVALMDHEVSSRRICKRIQKWDERDLIAAVQRTEVNPFGVLVGVGPKRFRLGDVLDRMKENA